MLFKVNCIITILNLKFPIEEKIKIYYTVIDAITKFGGYITIITSIFITIPVLLFSKNEFKNYIV